MLNAISKWCDARAYKKLCKFLVKRFGGPEWYSAGQVAKAIEETGLNRLDACAQQVLTKEMIGSNDGSRESFSEKFLEGREKYTARDVVRRFVGATYYSQWQNPNQPRQDILYGG